MKEIMKTKKRRQGRLIKVPILNDEYAVMVCWGSKAEIAAYIKEQNYGNSKTKDSLKNNLGLCFSGNKYPLITLILPPITPRGIGNLSHEAVHAITRMFQYLNIPRKGEVFAYSVDAIVRITLEEYQKTEW